MAYDLDVQQEQLTYTAGFSRPLLDVWGDGRTIVRGLYNALSPFGTSLSDIRLEPGQTNAADPVVTAKLGPSGIYRFTFDRVETVFANFSEEFFRSIPALLEASTQWIRATIPSAKFSSHQFVYFNHARLKNSSIEEFLKAVGPRSLPAGGIDRGSGVIFHWEIPERSWATQLVLDRSLLVSGGLYMMLTILIAADAINYGNLLVEGRSYLAALLGELGLNLPELATKS